MSDIIIQAEGVGKSYRIAHRAPAERYTALRDVLARQARDCWTSARRGFRGQRSPGADRDEEFWALRDVSFEVKRGEVLGIIGRNGAGKSTLLKILSRITELSEGRVRIGGRIASLLEVGTGFHPELTGRENIYLNGSILGMTRAEIRRKFDEIVAFADVEKFLDTAVKRYSSGMYVRLAFAVAAHLDPEILVVDEVLAVGDAQFQKKCLGKMSEVAKGGRTVLFVSHNMSAVRALCGRAIYLTRGQLALHGACADVVASYMAQTSEARAEGAAPRVSCRLNAAATLKQISVNPPSVASGEAVDIRLPIEAEEDESVAEMALLIYNHAGVRAAIIDLRSADGPRTLVAGAVTTFEIHVRALPLVDGEYELGLWYLSNRSCSNHYNIGTLVVFPRATDSGLATFGAEHRGIVELSHRLTVAADDAGRTLCGSHRETVMSPFEY